MEKTHFVKLPLEDGAGTISLLFTITGIYSKENTDTDKDASSQPNHDEIIRKYVCIFKNTLIYPNMLKNIFKISIKIGNSQLIKGNRKRWLVTSQRYK